MAFMVAGCRSASPSLNIDFPIPTSLLLQPKSVGIRFNSAKMNHFVAIIKMSPPDRCSLCVGGHHGGGGGSGRDEGGAAMSCGRSAPRRRGGVLGKRRTISVWLPQHRDPPSCWSGDLQEVQQVSRPIFSRTVSPQMSQRRVVVVMMISCCL